MRFSEWRLCVSDKAPSETRRRHVAATNTAGLACALQQNFVLTRTLMVHSNVCCRTDRQSHAELEGRSALLICLHDTLRFLQKIAVQSDH